MGHARRWLSLYLCGWLAPHTHRISSTRCRAPSRCFPLNGPSPRESAAPEIAMKAFPPLASAVYAALALLLAIHCYRTPLYDIDLLSYMGNVALTDTTDLRAVHRAVYSGPLTPHLRGLDANDRQALVLRHRAADPYYSALYLPYFSVKPLYVLALEAAHKSGASLVGSSRIISALFFFGIAVVVWLYSR